MPNPMLFGEPIGQSWLQLSELALAFVLSALIGLEREKKSAGLRTYTLVGVSSALTMLVSKYGFTDIIESGRVVLDPSRVAAHYDGFHRLAHSRSGNGRWSRPSDPAIAVTCAHFIVVFIFPAIERNFFAKIRIR